MPVIIEPVPGRAHQRVRGVVLAGAQYNLTLRYNQTDDAWYMDVADFEDNMIAVGLKLVLGAYIGRQSTHPLFLNGAFFLVDTTDEGREATFQDLGTRVVLSYWLAQEIAVRGMVEAQGESDSER